MNKEEEILFHKKQAEFCTSIIEGILAHNKLFELYINMNPLGHISKMDLLLDTANENEFYIQSFSKLYKQSEKFLLDHGVDPYGPMTEKEKEEFRILYPDPYRLRFPPWIRIPIINFFKSLKFKSYKKKEN